MTPRRPRKWGRRDEDVMPKSRFKRAEWRLALAVRRSPIMSAFIAALLAAMVPVLIIIDQQQQIREANTGLRQATHELQSSTRQISKIQEDGQESRKNSARAYCDAINDNARRANRLANYLEDVYRRPAPGDPARTAAQQRRAEEIADQIRLRKIPPLNCEDYVNQIEREG